MIASRQNPGDGPSRARSLRADAGFVSVPNRNGLPYGGLDGEIVFHAEMNTRETPNEPWDESSSGTGPPRADARTMRMFAVWFERSADATFLYDPRRAVLTGCNPAALALLRAPRVEEILGRHPGEFAPELQPDGGRSRDRAVEVMQLALRRGSWRFEWLARRLDGSLVPLEVLLTVVGDDEEPLIAVVCRDTTERRRREQTQQAVYQISEAVHAAADLSSLYARIHGIVRGLMPAENFFIALYEPATEMISFPYYVDEFSRDYPQPRRISTGLTGLVLRTGRAVLADRQFAERSRREDNRVVVEALGGVSYIESGRPAAVWLGVPLTIQGQPIGVMAVQDYRDEDAYGEDEEQILAYVATQTAVAIERKRSEESLRDLVAKHRALFEGSSQGVMLHDDRRFLEVNAAAVRILGRRDAGEVVGRHPSEFAPPFQPDGESSEALARRQIACCIETGSVRFEWDVLRSDGRIAPVDVLLTRVQWGGRWLIQAMVEDITERKRAEAELLRSLAREKELSQLKTSFVATVSHEFRTPLAIILSSSQILSEYFDRLEPAEREEHLLSIARNTRQMASLMEEVLVLSRLDSGRMAFDPVPLDLGSLCRRFVEEVSAAAQGQPVIRLQVGSDCAAVRSDAHLLRHVVLNLLSNAVKYSAPGETVDFDVRRDGGELVLRVRDRGIGIPAADREWLFSAFHRGRNVGERPGSGLGLTIVKRCVELHGGRIALDSEVGRGTEIVVRLPVPPVETPSPPDPR